ncbi:MAG: hypothetical protein J2P28_17470, partial [Actinobacteria bacterium]|nr:hypothetical protein [Actinomycetota bacterium]
MSPAPAAARPNIRLASQEAARLLALTPVPANSVALTKPPAVPSRWFGPVVASRVDRSRAWRVPLSMSAAAGWIA